MKVKITKTIGIEQIPSESRRMLDQVKNNLLYQLPDKMSQVVMHSLSNQGEEFFKTIELIDSFRKELAVFDESLQEVQNILEGYRQALMPISEELEEEYNEEWLAKEEAETEKRQAQQMDVEDDDREQGEEHEEG